MPASERSSSPRLEIPKPGKYWLLTEPIGGRKIQAVGQRRRQGQAGSAGGRRAAVSLEHAYARERHDQAAVDLDACRTASSTASRSKDALAAKVPFVVTFATPAYCQSRTCGPIVDVVSAVRKREAGSNVRFIHVEVYEDNDPAKGENQWFKEWHLPSRAVGLPRRARRQGARAVRRHRLRERARRGRQEVPARVAVRLTFWEHAGRRRDGRRAGDDGMARGAPR